MREITSHHDGHGLAESIKIEADDIDPVNGGASHVYTVKLGSEEIGRFQFQHGPRNAPGSKPGAIDAVILAIFEDRMKCFQAGPFADRANALALTKVQEARFWLKHRADERAARGVLGKNVK